MSLIFFVNRVEREVLSVYVVEECELRCGREEGLVGFWLDFSYR